MSMKLRQGQFSYLPDFTEEEIAAQIRYAIQNGWGISIEYTDDPHPRNDYWEFWDVPMFGIEDESEVLEELRKCREEHPNIYVGLTAYRSDRNRQGPMLHFIVQRPADEPGFRLERQSKNARVLSYKVNPYATEKPAGQRYDGSK